MEETQTDSMAMVVAEPKNVFDAAQQEPEQNLAQLWKKRYETSLDFYKKGDNKNRTENIIKYLHNEWSAFKGVNENPFINQFFIGLKTLIPMVVAHNPFVAVNADNDFVYEYDDMGEVVKGPDGQPIMHDVTKVASTIQALLKKRLNKKVKFKREIRKFLRDAITFNRGIFIVGHTANSEYSGSFNEPTFHAYIKSVPPYKIKRQAGTKRINEGTYFFYEYELPLSHLKDSQIYPQELIAKCTKTILEEINIEDSLEFEKADSMGLYDDVQYVKMRNGYDLLTGKVYVFGEGCDQPLKVIEPEYSFMDPSIEFVPNELFQPEQDEPISDLMMCEPLVKSAQVVFEKAVKHVQDFNTGYDVEKGALLNRNDKKRFTKGLDRSVRVWENTALSGGKVQSRGDLQMGPEPLNMVEYLFGYVQKILSVYDFQQGGGEGSQDETATKTQAKLQTSNFKGGDMAEMFSDACNEAIEKYLEILIKTTDVNEVVQVMGDAGETEYREFNKDEAQRGQYYCEVDLQSMGKVNQDVKIQQALKLYEIVKSDPDPQVMQQVNKVELFKMIVKGLGLGNEGILRKIPDTQGMDEQKFRDFLKQQILKAKHESEQALAGANILPPSPDDDDDIHLSDHLGKAQELKMQAANSPDPMLQQQLQAKIGNLVSHAQIHIQRKQEKEMVEQRANPGSHTPSQPQQQAQQVPVSNKPPMAGNVAGQAQRTGMLQ